MRTTYRIDIRRPGEKAWTRQTRVKTKPIAEETKQAWEQRGFEVNIVTEK